MNNNEKNRGNLGAVTRLLRLSLAAELNFNCDYVDEFYLLSTGFYLCLPFARPPTPHPQRCHAPRLNQVLNLMKSSTNVVVDV